MFSWGNFWAFGIPFSGGLHWAFRWNGWLSAQAIDVFAWRYCVVQPHHRTPSYLFFPESNFSSVPTLSVPLQRNINLKHKTRSREAAIGDVATRASPMSTRSTSFSAATFHCGVPQCNLGKVRVVGFRNGALARQTPVWSWRPSFRTANRKGHG